MSSHHKDTPLITCRPVPLTSHQQFQAQNSFGWSPVALNSVPNQFAQMSQVSPLLVVTPMDTPMVEDDSDDKENPQFLDMGVFAFDEQMEPQKTAQRKVSHTLLPTSKQHLFFQNYQYQQNKFMQPSLPSTFFQPQTQQPLANSLNQFQNIQTQNLQPFVNTQQQQNVSQPFIPQNTQCTEPIATQQDFDSDSFTESSEDNESDQNDEEHQTMQEVLQKVEELKRIGDERNRLLHQMIENQK
ncbi:hypothetical protein EIN_034590 [Entamoeba invadens IP1]|uniref:Uncharacterized protein n=1 Tax=Entamoeba invadens IP1 TaxID=370355 RepID=A0A0A1U1N5_ENTIV|nr:hypothetical protein EIN_034590 [Entamoeba invadens IP1]ELP86518.1 hypothetical protein EIN_034590 [Entamoeba invadens IP1]|eukprot:XP_004185864.1 hypothetical protein EIN_034590 [Entamoeba invadens IP1]